MCSSPKVPAAPAPQPTVAAPTVADAATSKTAAGQRNKAAALAGRDIKTSPRGLGDEAQTKKKNLLGA